MNREEPSAPVPERDKQAEEDLWQRHKAERGVWTEPMLVALERGLKGKKWFDAIPHDRLLALVRGHVADGRVLGLIEGLLKQGVMEGTELAKVVEDMPEDEPQGTPQGGVISPLLANIYLDPLDWLMAGLGFEMVRYADDMVVLCRSQEAAGAGLEKLREWMAGAGLTLHPDKTRTRRANGRSMKAIVADLNRTLPGWFGYFKHAKASELGGIDGWIRMRLRSILRKRRGLKGRGCGSDHQRWPNRYFTKLGLFCLLDARKSTFASLHNGANH